MGRPTARLLVPLIAFTALTIALMGPIFKDPSRRVYGLAGDPLAEVWRMNLFRSGQLELLSSKPVTSANFPEGVVLRRPVEASQILYDAPSWLVAQITRPVLAYNLLAFAAILTSALAMYWSARRFGLSVWSSLFAGAAYTIAPVHMTEARLHLALAHVAALPIVLALCGFATVKKSLRVGALAGLTIGATAYLNPYTFLESMIIWTGVTTGAIALKSRPWPMLVGLVCSVMVVLPLAFVYVLFDQDITAAVAKPLSELYAYAAHPFDYVDPGGTLYLGVVVLALALGGLFVSRLPTQLRVFAAFSAALALTLTFPPRLDLGGLRLTLPSGWLYELFPYFRVIGRFSIVVVLATALLAAGFLEQMTRKYAKRKVALVVAIAVLALTDLASLPEDPAADLARNDPVSEWISARQGAVVEFPLLGFNDGNFGGHLFRQMRHSRPLFNGGVPRSVSGDFGLILESRVVDAATVLWLLGVRSGVLHSSEIPLLEGMRLDRVFASGARGVMIEPPDKRVTGYLRTPNSVLAGDAAEEIPPGSEVVVITGSPMSVRVEFTMQALVPQSVRVGQYRVQIGATATSNSFCTLVEGAERFEVVASSRSPVVISDMRLSECS